MDQTLIVLIIFIITTAILISNRIRYDIVGIATVLVLIALGIVTPSSALLSIGSLPVIVLATLMIISRSISSSGIIDKFGELLTRRIKNEYVMLAVLFAIIGLVSGFMSDVALTLMMVPLSYFIADRMKKSPSKYLMPFAFMAVLGGRYTVASTSSNVILYDLWYTKYHTYLPFFQFAMPGIIITLVGVPLALIISRFLPNRKQQITNPEEFKTGEYLTEVSVEAESEIIGKTVNEFEKAYQVRVVGIYPGRISRGTRIIRKDNVLIVRLRPEVITVLSGIKGLRMAPAEPNVQGKTITEVFVTPESRVVNSTLSDLHFSTRYNVAVLGISAYGKRIFGRLRTIRVEVGDVLMLGGDDKDIAEFMSQENLAPLTKRELRVYDWRRGVLGLISLSLAVLLASFGINLAFSFAIGLFIMILTRATSYKLMYRYVEWPIVIFVGTYLVFGSAIISSGLSGMIGDLILGSGVILFLMTLLLSNTIGNIGSAVIMGPIALAFPDPLKAIVVVAMAASCTFLTPFSNQSNLIVQSPGNYKTKDFSIFGFAVVIMVFIFTMIYYGAL